MNKILLICAVCLAASTGLHAQSDSVGLGITAGVAVPHGGSREYTVSGSAVRFSYGFYVNIPLIHSFHITPSALVYTIGEANATDMDIAFKFIVPARRLKLYAGFMPGLTAANNTTNPHVGALVGTGFNLISNLDLFVDLAYKVAFAGDTNYRIFHAHTGLLFRF